jgi:AcrR family transcriptional regulator
VQGAVAHRGRHPSPETESAILEATREILAKDGVQGLTIEGVAARSGVAKTTIYRRWRSKHDLALAVLIEMVEQQVQSSHDLGDTRAELVAFVNRAIKILNSTLMGRVMQGLVSDLAADPELAKAFRARVVTRRVEELTRILERAIERGSIRRDADIEIANELLFGPVYYRLFLSGKPLNKDFAERTVDAFMANARATRAAPRRSPEP